MVTETDIMERTYQACLAKCAAAGTGKVKVPSTLTNSDESANSRERQARLEEENLDLITKLFLSEGRVSELELKLNESRAQVRSAEETALQEVRETLNKESEELRKKLKVFLREKAAFDTEKSKLLQEKDALEAEKKELLQKKISFENEREGKLRKELHDQILALQARIKELENKPKISPEDRAILLAEKKRISEEAELERIAEEKRAIYARLESTEKDSPSGEEYPPEVIEMSQRVRKIFNK